MKNFTETLTEGEVKALKAVCEAAIDSTGGDFTYADEVETEFSFNQLGGYISQLTQKGWIYVTDDKFKQIGVAHPKCDDFQEIEELIK